MSLWDRSKVEEELAGRLWRYLSSAAVRSALPASVEDVFRLERGGLRQLVGAHIVTSSLAEDMLESAEQVLRRLPSSLTPSMVETVGRVAGPVNWGRTRQRRIATGDPTRFVCEPPERRYDTPVARLVKLSLTLLVRASDEAPKLPASGQLGRRFNQHLDRARILLTHRKLEGVALVRSMPYRTLTSLEHRQGCAPLVAFVRSSMDALEMRDAGAVAQALSSQLLTPASDDTLYELLVGFRLVDALAESGYAASSESVLPNATRPFVVADGPLGRIRLWWQRPLAAARPDHTASSTYREVLRGAGMSQSSLRPDFLIDGPGSSVLVVEVKHTAREGYTPERAGIVDALAYLSDARETFSRLPEPHALVVAWNATGSPSRSPVMVADDNQIEQALELYLSSAVQPGD